MSDTQFNPPKLPVVYFGSGPLAAESLAFLHDTFLIEAVITKPRAAQHKGAVPVIEFCDAHGLKYFTPASKSELTELFEQQKFTSQLGVVIDYGIIISRDVIDRFELGIVNSHFSLLPEWRGADPISFAILSGRPTTGVSLMLIDEKMDEGPLLAQAAVDITVKTNAITLTQELIEVSNALLGEILPLYSQGIIQPVAQTSGISNSTEASYSRKLTKADGILDWQKPAKQLEREVRAYIEWPKSRTTLGEMDILVTAAHVVSGGNNEPGAISVQSDTDELRIQCSQDSLSIERVKPAGKKEMTVAEFIRGYGSRLS